MSRAFFEFLAIDSGACGVALGALTTYRRVSDKPSLVSGTGWLAGCLVVAALGFLLLARGP